MPCFSPLQGWLSKKRNAATGKRSVVFNACDGLSNRPVDVPCGQCVGCRVEYSRSWAIRCMHEASLYDENCYITLTYDDDHLPERGTLLKKDCQDFLKRLRSRFADKRIRYYLSGEYGDDELRPHYHALLFGFDLPDKKHFSTRAGNPVWTSNLLEQIWGKGITEVSEVTFASAAYCARYMVKKFKGPPQVVEAYYDGLEPEFALMSRGARKGEHGIGYDYYQKHGKEIYQHDSVIINGREQKPPKYYDKMFEADSPVTNVFLKQKRKDAAREMFLKDGRGDSKLLAEKAIVEARIQLRKESLNA